MLKTLTSPLRSYFIQPFSSCVPFKIHACFTDQSLQLKVQKCSTKNLRVIAKFSGDAGILKICLGKLNVLYYFIIAQI